MSALESRVTAEDGEWDPVRVIDTMSSYGWNIDEKRARALLRTLSEQEVLEKIPGRSGRAVYRTPGARDWLYCLDPELSTVDEGPSTPARVARLAREGSGSREWWLAKPLRKMRDGDRLWFYFFGVEAKIAAMAHVNSQPRPSQAGSDKPYEVDATLDPKATAALRKTPVRLEEMEQQHPQGSDRCARRTRSWPPRVPVFDHPAEGAPDSGTLSSGQGVFDPFEVLRTEIATADRRVPACLRRHHVRIRRQLWHRYGQGRQGDAVALLELTELGAGLSKLRKEPHPAPRMPSCPTASSYSIRTLVHRWSVTSP
ncbi:hypothetical protein ACFVY1_25685 [Streptomyces sp. NPDC058293]|uniref:hypothetical protein n=1 Tax=Streptomyces sp. NPDC058293 TaxID=3346429 RepID=UPI0036EE7495